MVKEGREGDEAGAWRRGVGGRGRRIAGKY